jgi:hypothetical protein
MKMPRYQFAIVLVLGLTSVAKAGPVSFQMVVVDPNVPIDLIQPIFSTNFPLTFPTTGCQASQGVDPSVYSACFTGINLTGKALTSLDIELPVDPGVAAICPSPGSFSGVTCSSTSTDYLFDFTGGDIPTATLFNTSCSFPKSGPECGGLAIFTIAIGEEDANGAPVVISNTYITQIDSDHITAQANAPTPEPNSLLLMSTGVLSIGLFGAFRRRQALAVARSRATNFS